MSIFNWFNWRYRRGSAPVARDRLKILLEHEGRRSIKSDLLGLLRGEIVAVICRHVTVEPENVQVTMNRGATVSTLAIDIEIPA
ncbi:MAG: cell division topological specificity factor MinE [Pseudolabrys sp.]|jgi:cell division topological specificity factor